MWSPGDFCYTHWTFSLSCLDQCQMTSQFLITHMKFKLHQVSPVDMSPAEPSVSKDYDIEFGEENNDHGYDGDDDGVYPMETADGNYTPGREESSKYIVQEVVDNGDDNETVASKDSCQQKDDEWFESEEDEDESSLPKDGSDGELEEKYGDDYLLRHRVDETTEEDSGEETSEEEDTNETLTTTRACREGDSAIYNTSMD